MPRQSTFPNDTGRGFDMNAGIRLVLAFIQLFIAAIVLILGAAFVLGLLGADPDVPFVAWISARTTDIMAPFEGIFDEIELTDASVFRPSLLFAMAVYAIVGSVLTGTARRFF